MAEILKGESGHHTYAPLSHSQTLSICQHLEQLIRELQASNQELRRDLTHAEREIVQVRDGLGGTNSLVAALQDGLQKADVAIDNLKKDQARTGNKVNKLGLGLEQCGENGTKLGEINQVTNAHLHNTRSEVNSLTDRVNDIQTKIETNVNNDTSQLKEILAQANTAIKNLRDDAERQRAQQQEQREALRLAGGRLQGLGDDLTKTNANSHVLEQRVQGLQGSLKTTQQGLQETNAVALKIHEDHKNTKAQLGATQDNLKKCTAAVKKAHEGLDMTAQKLHDTHDQLQKTVTGLAQTKSNLERTTHQVHSLNDSHDMLSSNTAQMRLHLEDTSAMVSAVKAGLKETNSIVLPNLQMESNRPWSLMSTDRTLKPLSTRGSKKATPTRGISMEQDEMALFAA